MPADTATPTAYGEPVELAKRLGSLLANTTPGAWRSWLPWPTLRHRGTGGASETVMATFDGNKLVLDGRLKFVARNWTEGLSLSLENWTRSPAILKANYLVKQNILPSSMFFFFPFFQDP